MSASLLFEAPKRVAFIASADVVRATIPAGIAGVYFFLRGGRPFYVGRSDSCLRTRISNHERLAEAGHVTWDPCQSARTAFLLESAWYHRLGHGALQNRVHPARPCGDDSNCPFCDVGDIEALQRVLRTSTDTVHRVCTNADHVGGTGQNNLRRF